MSGRLDHGAGWDDESEHDEPRALTRDEAQALRARLPSVSPWRVVAAQAVAGGLFALLCWGVSGKSGVGWSALYGAAAIVLPQAVLVRGIARLAGMGPVAGAAGIMFLEGLKLLLTVAMLVAAAWLVSPLSWPALLAALAVCLGTNWLALLWRGTVKKLEQSR